ncbi:MAG: sigma-54-dependent Fis family transcriptional regulator [Deltaproteobacteria bacterium]|nr:MAG: sigma-54-dependent Fis family transcriptional regulator [Deltaproteobacteria bacterium]
MADQAKIYLLDLNPASDLGTTLQGILVPSLDSGILFRHESIEVCEPAFGGSKLTRIIAHFKPDVLFLVLSPSHLKQTGTLFQSTSRELSEFSTIIVVEECNPDEMFALLKLGASDFITPPLKAINILPRLWRLVEQTRRSETLTRTLKEKLGLRQLVGESPAFLAETKKIPIMAKCDANILLSGETGTGKELCARAIHYLSPRASKPFLPVNCGAIPAELIENELFGHVRGAFTGASVSQTGLIHEALGGTLFLDEIDCLSLSAQAKLLRFLQEKEYRQLGSTKMCQADVRVIVATNLDLEEAVREGKFRQDLYYRLNIVPLMLPPLRERREDIPLLAHHFLEKHAFEFNKQVTGFASDAMRMLVLYKWPGNVRELEYVVERAVLFSEQAVIGGTDIFLPHPKATTGQESLKEAKAKVIAQFERTYIQELLLAYQGNITKAAQAAQKNRRAFWQLIRKHRIDVQSFKPGQ